MSDRGSDRGSSSSSNSSSSSRKSRSKSRSRSPSSRRHKAGPGRTRAGCCGSVGVSVLGVLILLFIFYNGIVYGSWGSTQYVMIYSSDIKLSDGTYVAAECYAVSVDGQHIERHAHGSQTCQEGTRRIWNPMPSYNGGSRTLIRSVVRPELGWKNSGDTLPQLATVPSTVASSASLDGRLHDWIIVPVPLKDGDGQVYITFADGDADKSNNKCIRSNDPRLMSLLTAPISGRWPAIADCPKPDAIDEPMFRFYFKPCNTFLC